MTFKLKKIPILFAKFHPFFFYMLEICQNIQKVDYQGAEGVRDFFSNLFLFVFFNIIALFLINVNIGF